MFSLNAFTLSILLLFSTAATAQSLGSVRMECFKKLNLTSSKFVHRLNEDEFLFDSVSSSLFKVSSKGLEECSLSVTQSMNERIYISYRPEGSMPNTPSTIFSYARSMGPNQGETPNLHPGFSALSKFEKAMVRPKNLVPLSCKPVSPSDETKIWNKLILASQAKEADFSLGIRYLATLLPLVKDPDQAPYREAIAACRKIDDKDFQKEIADLQSTLDRHMKSVQPSGPATAK